MLLLLALACDADPDKVSADSPAAIDSSVGPVDSAPARLEGPHDQDEAALRYASAVDDDQLGAEAFHLGDLTGDGLPELFVSAPQTPGERGAAGAAWLLSPAADAAGLHDVAEVAVARVRGEGRTDNDGLGAQAASADLDGDGQLDLLLGATFDRNDVNPGQAWLLWGPLPADLELGAPDLRLVGESAGDSFGEHVAALPCHHLDEAEACQAAFAVSARTADPLTRLQAGSVWIFAASREQTRLTPNQTLARLDGAGETTGMGSDLAVDDLDGDGISEIFIAALERDDVFNNTGSVLAWRGPVEGPLGEDDADLLLRGGEESETFGAHLSVADVDGDGLPELMATSARLPTPERARSAHLVSGARLSAWLEQPLTPRAVDLVSDLIVLESEAASEAELELRALGDLDGDGALELGVGEAGRVCVFYGPVALEGQTVSCEDAPLEVSGPGRALGADLDGDGASELVTFTAEGEVEGLHGLVAVFL
ncbi:MAG: VCBS repeat-containing protein [Alphaproteobacteria bacterium]|nr:VCBS repeat-containing protein [Alphaproteobacteria bacterium]